MIGFTMAEGFTQVPNWILDNMAAMHASTLQVVLCICRKTIGYTNGNGGRKEWDRISLSQFKDNTNLSRQGVVNAINDALEKGYIERRERGQYFEYKLVNSVDQLNQSNELTSQLSVPVPVNSVDQLTPKLVNSVDTQKKDIKESKEIDSSSDDEAAPTGDKPSAPTPVSKKPKAKREPKPKQDSAAEKVPTEHQEMFGALCKLVGWDYAVITKEQAGQVAQTLGVLKKSNYTIEDLRKFYLYWRDKDWRGQKGQYPTLSLVRSEIGKIRLNENGNGHNVSMSRRVQVLS